MAAQMQTVTFGRRPQPKVSAVNIDQEVDNRLALYEPVPLHSLSTASVASSNSNSATQATALAAQKQSKVKTSHVLIFMCLHIGSDPPDVARIEPCAKLECWTDPSVAQARCLSRGSEGVAETLEQQYRLIQKDAMYKKVTEVTVEDAKQQLQGMRRKARDGRVLFHYNGHGMPKATRLGELWFFDKERTHYVPMNINEVAMLLESPAIYVFDCNSAGSLLNLWMHRGDPSTANRLKDFMICACSDGEMLPMNPLLPADVLTSCLTTPIKMALEWYISYSYRKILLPDVTEEMIRRIPGDLGDRKTPLGELNWIFTAVTDTIAWCTTPELQFHQLFRQDVVVKSLFRNYLLAEKLLREVGCTPVTYPQLPEMTHSHYMWDTWEVAMESIICQLPNILNSDMTVNTMYTYKPTTFFSDQLTAFEVWIEEGDCNELPEQLPCVVLSLTQISHRVRALTLLSSYLSTGQVAVAHAIRCGVLLYVSKLLNHTPEVFLLVTLVWSQLVAVDAVSASSELIKNQADKHFIRLLQLEKDKVVLLKESELHSGMPSPVSEDVPTFYDVEGVDLTACKSAACFILCKMLDHGGEKIYTSCWNHCIVKAVFPLLCSASAELRSWACLILAKVFSGLRAAKEFACREYTSRINLFTNLLSDREPLVRSSAVTLLASLLGTRIDMIVGENAPQQQLRRIEGDKTILIRLRNMLFDVSRNVREEVAFACAQIFYHYGSLADASVSTVDAILGKRHQQQADMSESWMLQEAGVSVKSALSAARPTDNILFDDSIQFNTTFLAKDDPPPSAAWDTARISDKAFEIVHSLLHDASLMLCTLYQNSDQRLVLQVAEKIQSNTRVASFRLTAESNKIALQGIYRKGSASIAPLSPFGSALTATLSEDDRATRNRNRDFMRRLYLDLQGKKFEPPSISPVSSGASTPVAAAATAGSSPLGLGSSSAVPAEAARPTLSITSCFTFNHDAVACGKFRLLEPHVIVAERNGRISVIDYESKETPDLRMQFTISGVAPIHDLLVINDLATNPGLVVLDKQGIFSVFSGIGDAQGEPLEVRSFSAGAAGQFSDFKMDYRADGHLIYTRSSRAGESPQNEIVLISLVEEQVAQRISVVGSNVAVTALAVHPTGRSIFVGTSDGVVKYYDDRSKQGSVSAVSNVQRSGAMPCAADSVVGLSICEDTSAATNIMVCAASTIRIFDLRKPTEPTKAVDLVQGITAAVSRASIVGVNANSARAVAGFRGGLYTGLCGAVYSDGLCDLYNSKAQSVLPKPHKLKDGCGIPGATFVHPLRPLAFFNGELVALL